MVSCSRIVDGFYEVIMKNTRNLKVKKGRNSIIVSLLFVGKEVVPWRYYYE